ncbi:hypothetical protein [Corynebacterium diphtheriae]|uniref:hypothetical protein n=1 Tax=Corynebacterium diphtheriae TaxID=1717 RepID=UPI00086A0FBF|nr:hypothetical protein [Corynebacterium diphtheriae]AWR15527.1 hypothetical protein B11Q_00827 [Corynebacterium diphtheriae]OEH71613.1 hypothetical protein BHU48_03580 [Corynebacterium diphtheriae]OMO44629.1 hypothetical protein BVL41_03970 [Corynebacterium diphtheriae]RLP16742.1 hypothetical protein D9R16_03625 [Corynebacterium diphtheriae]CAB0543316.1 hypothetical protein CIP107517_00699 [Corynebacterium diphtheriae]
MLATLSDVEARLGELLDDDADVRRAEGLLAEASALVVGYIGHRPEPVPDAVALVVSRMVARVLEAPEDAGFNAESASYTAGPFSQNVKFSAGASGGSPWLTASDKVMLRPYWKRRKGVFSMTMR